MCLFQGEGKVSVWGGVGVFVVYKYLGMMSCSSLCTTS